MTRMDHFQDLFTNVVEGVFSEVWQDESPTASSHWLHLRCSLGQERLGYIGGPTGTAPTALHGGKKPLPALIHQRRGRGVLRSSHAGCCIAPVNHLLMSKPSASSAQNRSSCSSSPSSKDQIQRTTSLV